MGLRPINTEKHFAVGSYFHELAHYYGQLLKSGYKVGDKHTEAAMDQKMRADIEEVVPEFIPVLLQVHIMFRRYLERRTKDIDGGIKIVEVEYEALYQFDDLVELQGIIDLIYRRRDKLVVRDYKTGENKSSHSADSLEMDDQLLTYAVIVWKLFGEVPDVEIQWINSKVDYKTTPSNDQLFATHYKALDESYLEAIWTEITNYVYHMKTVKPIRFINGYKCKSCIFKDVCLFSMRGLPTDNLIQSKFKVVPRNYDFRKFTEIAQRRSKNSTVNSPDQGSGNSGSSGGFTFNFT